MQGRHQKSIQNLEPDFQIRTNGETGLVPYPAFQRIQKGGILRHPLHNHVTQGIHVVEPIEQFGQPVGTGQVVGRHAGSFLN